MEPRKAVAWVEIFEKVIRISICSQQIRLSWEEQA